MMKTFRVEIQIEGHFDAEDLEYIIKAGFGESQGGPYPSEIKVIEEEVKK